MKNPKPENKKRKSRGKRKRAAEGECEWKRKTAENKRGGKRKESGTGKR